MEAPEGGEYQLIGERKLSSRSSRRGALMFNEKKEVDYTTSLPSPRSMQNGTSPTKNSKSSRGPQQRSVKLAELQINDEDGVEGDEEREEDITPGEARKRKKHARKHARIEKYMKAYLRP